MPCFAVAAVNGGEQNGFNQIYYFRIFNSEIIFRASLRQKNLRMILFRFAVL